MRSERNEVWPIRVLFCLSLRSPRDAVSVERDREKE